MKMIQPDFTPAAQGDLMVRRVKSLPRNAEAQNIPARGVIIAHSETGHNHVANGASAHYTLADNVLCSFLVSNKDIDIVHHRPHDTHETLRLLAEGEGETIWEIRRQREYVPEGWRRVED